MAVMAASDSASPSRAPCGHTAMHRMHEMHAAASTRAGSALSMAPAGQRAAHTPQRTQAAPGAGTVPRTMRAL